jgi:hypothetical protein
MSDLFEHAQRQAPPTIDEELQSMKIIDAIGKVTAGRRLLR